MDNTEEKSVENEIIGTPISFNSINDFCKVRNTIRYSTETEQTKRLQWLLATLDASNIDYDLDRFEYVKGYLYNIILPGTSDKWVSAHYDVVNTSTDNANDNSASVINAIMLKKLYPSVNVVLLDGEEPPVMGGGSRHMAKRMNNGDFGNVKYVLNFELSGKGGENFFIGDYPGHLSDSIVKLFPDTPIMQTPFNDAEMFYRTGIDSLVINPLPVIEKETQLQNDNGYLDFSMLFNCHSSKDTLATISSEDMETFVKNIVIPILKNS